MSQSLRRSGIALALLAVLAVFVARAEAAEQQPDSHTQPLLDGCQRSQSLNLAVSTPEWVYVNSNDVRLARLTGDATAGRRTLEGVVSESRPAGEDLYLNHDFHDYNVLVRPDPAYAGLLGSGNLNPNPREYGLVEGEWETSKIPLWARASRGDRVRMSGNWIWDCGHWGNSAADRTGLSQLLVYDPIETIQDIAQPGAIRGETTELHPMYELATFRANAAGRLLTYGPRLLSRLDVWINGEGGMAQAAEECALSGVNNAVVARAVCRQGRDVAGTYTYVMQLVPRPSTRSKLIINPVFVRPETLPELAALPVSVRPDAHRGIVTVSFTLPHLARSQRFGITVAAGWSDAPRAAIHTVTLNTITIVRALDGSSEPNLNPGGVPGEQVTEPGEWVLYANISGHWVQIPHLAQVTDGQMIPLGITLRFALPAGVKPTLYVSGHECDEPLIDCVHEAASGTADTLGSTELGFNDRPGRIQNDRFGVPLALGTVTYHPPANPDPNGGNEDLSDAVCGSLGCYLLSVTWRSGF
jgi:hypothetical protein